MYCLPFKAKTIEELREKINLLCSEYYPDYIIHEMNHTAPTDECEYYSCLVLLTEEDK